MNLIKIGRLLPSSGTKMYENKIKVIANMPNGYESNNRIYSPNGGGQNARGKRLEGRP